MTKKKRKTLREVMDTPGALKRAARDVEHRAEPTPDREPNVTLKPSDIVMWPELFQPRGFGFGVYNLDLDFVKQLQRAIANVGELDPPLVMRFKMPVKTMWVCVDGHHRLEAYRRAGWKPEIKCEQFIGTVWEAIDEGVRRNIKVKLPMTRQDNLNQAWKHTALGRGSKAEVAKLWRDNLDENGASIWMRRGGRAG